MGTVNDSRALCPNEWHVPSDGEWTQLTDFLGGTTYAGNSMKASPDDSPGWNGNNQSGFTGLPGWLFELVRRYEQRLLVEFLAQGSYAGAVTGLNYDVSKDGLSVRCIRRLTKYWPCAARRL